VISVEKQKERTVPENSKEDKHSGEMSGAMLFLAY
jgi:hypothetical protein